MNYTIEKRRLTEAEVDSLIEEIKQFPNPLTSKKVWMLLKKAYIMGFKNDLVGVCAIGELDNYLKLGPFVVFKKYHNQGYGKIIMDAIIKDHPHANLFIGSRSPAIAKIALRYGFKEVPSMGRLPHAIQLYLITNFLQNLSLKFILDIVKKKPTQEGPYRLFIKIKYT